MKSIPSTSAAGSRHPEYEIFINHRGPDSKLTFVAHLAAALREKHYKPFVDNHDLRQGGVASADIQAALKGAPIQLAVFTSGYAESTYCLDELVGMLECCKRDEENIKLVPVFLGGVEPEDLEEPDGGVFKEAFQKHESSAACDDDIIRIQRWKEALMTAGTVTGFCSSRYAWDEDKLMRGIISRVVEILGVRVERKQRLKKFLMKFDCDFRYKISYSSEKS